MTTEEPCSCSGPGFCPRFQIEQQQYPWEVCQGKQGVEKGEAYRRKWSLRLVKISSPSPGPTAKPPAARTPVAQRERPKRQPKEPQKGIVIQVKKRPCRKSCQWAWVVILDGVPQESGQEETEEKARAAAEFEARKLEEWASAQGV